MCWSLGSKGATQGASKAPATTIRHSAAPIVAAG
jgi:hypothetical protein